MPGDREPEPSSDSTVELRRALAEEQAARSEAEVAGVWAAKLQDLARRLGEAVTTSDVALVAVHTFGAAEADRAAIVRTSPEGHLEALAHHGMGRWFPSSIAGVDLRRSTWASPVLDGTPVWVADRAEFEARHPGALIAELDPSSSSWCLLPLASARGVLGVLSLHWDEPQLLEPAHRSFLVVAGELIGASLSRVAIHEELQRAHDRLRAAYDQRDRVARTLRAGLAPRPLHLPPPLRADATLRVGTADQIGGDFYDATRAGDGWLLVLGDVCGKGAEAAALTALVRYTLRAAAMSTPDHDSLLRTVNRVLLEEDTELFCAVTLLSIQPEEAGARLEVSLAGQHQPRLCRAEGGTELLGTFGPLLGVFDDVTASTARAELAPGDLVVAFTDGLVERNRRFGEAEIDDLLVRMQRPAAPTTAVAQLVSAAYALPADRSDDVCVLAISR